MRPVHLNDSCQFSALEKVHKIPGKDNGRSPQLQITESRTQRRNMRHSCGSTLNAKPIKEARSKINVF